MKSFVRPLVLLLLLAAWRPAAAAEVIDRILLRVNSRVITQSLLDSRLAQTVRDSGVPADPARSGELKKSVMEELVNEALLLDHARDENIITTDADVEDQVKRLKEQNHVATDEDFARALEASGLTIDRLREQLRKSMTVQRVVGREVNSKVDLSDDALRAIYEREKESWRVPERARVAEVLIPAGPDAEARAREAAQRIKGGAKFEDVVAAYSEGATKSRGGDLGTVSKGELAPVIDEAVFSLPAGATSEPIRTKNDWHIVRVVERIPVSYRPFAEVKPDLLKREQETQFQKKLAEYLDKLKRDAVIRVSPDAKALYNAPLYEPPTQKAEAAAPAPGSKKK